MSLVDWIVLGAAVVVLLGGWVAFTATRLDRLHARLDAAQAALDAQLVRRVAAMRHAVESDVTVPVGAGDPVLSLPTGPDRARYETVAKEALAAAGAHRQAAENEVGRVVAELAAGEPGLGAEQLAELHESALRVSIARRFYNDAVRDTRALRGRRMPRLLHLGGHREMPQFFDIDDSVAEELGTG
jgi:hypothetical protein